MKRYADVDKLLDIIHQHDYPLADRLNSIDNGMFTIGIEQAIAEAENADAVEVVRCKDCKYWQDNNGGYPHEQCAWRGDETPDATDFCSDGKRKEQK